MLDFEAMPRPWLAKRRYQAMISSGITPVCGPCPECQMPHFASDKDGLASAINQHRAKSHGYVGVQRIRRDCAKQRNRGSRMQRGMNFDSSGLYDLLTTNIRPRATA